MNKKRNAVVFLALIAGLFLHVIPCNAQPIEVISATSRGMVSGTCCYYWTNYSFRFKIVSNPDLITVDSLSIHGYTLDLSSYNSVIREYVDTCEILVTHSTPVAGGQQVSLESVQNSRVNNTITLYYCQGYQRKELNITINNQRDYPLGLEQMQIQIPQ